MDSIRGTMVPIHDRTNASSAIHSKADSAGLVKKAAATVFSQQNLETAEKMGTSSFSADRLIETEPDLESMIQELLDEWIQESALEAPKQSLVKSSNPSSKPSEKSFNNLLKQFRDNQDSLMFSSPEDPVYHHDVDQIKQTGRKVIAHEECPPETKEKVQNFLDSIRVQETETEFFNPESEEILEEEGPSSPVKSNDQIMVESFTSRLNSAKKHLENKDYPKALAAYQEIKKRADSIESKNQKIQDFAKALSKESQENIHVLEKADPKPPKVKTQKRTAKNIIKFIKGFFPKSTPTVLKGVSPTAVDKEMLKLKLDEEKRIAKKIRRRAENGRDKLQSYVKGVKKALAPKEKKPEVEYMGMKGVYEKPDKSGSFDLIIPKLAESLNNQTLTDDQKAFLQTTVANDLRTLARFSAESTLARIGSLIVHFSQNEAAKTLLLQALRESLNTNITRSGETNSVKDILKSENYGLKEVLEVPNFLENQGNDKLFNFNEGTVTYNEGFGHDVLRELDRRLIENSGNLFNTLNRMSQDHLGEALINE